MVFPVEFRTRNCAEKSVSRNRKTPPNFSFPPSCDEGAGSNDQTWPTTTNHQGNNRYLRVGRRKNFVSAPPRLAQRGKGKEEGALDLLLFYGLAAARLGGKWQKCCANIILDCCLFLSWITFSFSSPRATFAFPILCFFLLGTGCRRQNVGKTVEWGEVVVAESTFFSCCSHRPFCYLPFLLFCFPWPLSLA